MNTTKNNYGYDHTLNQMVKAARAIVIRKHLEVGRKVPLDVVCFSCGNASQALAAEGLNVLSIGSDPKADFVPNYWFTAADILRTFPNRFDATSGHLTLSLMQEIAVFIRSKCYQYSITTGRYMSLFKNGLSLIQDLLKEDKNHYLPTGSGETLVILKLAYPELKLTASYNLGPETKFEKEAPLNCLVKLLAESVDKNYIF